MKKAMQTMFAKAVRKTAQATAQRTSCTFIYQPKVPAALKQNKKNDQ